MDTPDDEDASFGTVGKAPALPVLDDHALAGGPDGP